MREIRHIERHRRPKTSVTVSEQYTVGTEDDCFEVADAQRMKVLVDPNGERKRFTICFTGKLDHMMKSVNFNPDEVRTLSVRVSAEELDLAIHKTQDPVEFAILLSKYPWFEVWMINMVC